MDHPIMARSIKVDVNLRCDFEHAIIPLGKYAFQIKEGKAQGLYHGRPCYEKALEHYQELEKENVMEEDNE